MPGVVRYGDAEAGSCYQPCIDPPSTVARAGVQLLSYSPDVFTNGLATVRETDQGLTNCVCNAVYTNVEGSPNVFVNNLPVVRIGDENICNMCGAVGADVDGSGNVIAN